MKYVIALLALLAGISAQAATLSYTDGSGTVSCTTATAPVVAPTPVVTPPPVGGGNDRCAANGVLRKTDVTAMNWGSGVLKALNLKANEAYALSFTAPASMSDIRSIMTQYSAANKRITVSLDVCGFDTPLNNSAACSVQQGGRSVEAGPAYSPTNNSVCYVPPGTTYYVNIRNQIPGSNPAQSSCTNPAGCGFRLLY